MVFWAGLLSALLIATQNLYALDNIKRMRFQNLSLDDGLSQSTIYAMVQDEAGFLWFGTQEGLNRYDGYGFRIFRRNFDKSNSLLDNYVRALVVDRDGYLWVGTEEGLQWFEPDSESFFSLALQKNQDIYSQDRHIIGLWCDHENGLWVLSKNQLTSKPN